MTSAAGEGRAARTRPDWVDDAVFYQVVPDRFRNGDPANDPPGSVAWDASPGSDTFFGGDLAGLIEGLPYLEELGIDAIYSTPVFAAGTNHRYDTHDYFAVDPALGDEELLARFVDEAHARGIRVLLDGVFNHVGDGFWAFRDVAARGAASPYRDWFTIDGFPLVPEPPSYQTCGACAYLPKLNLANPEVAEHLLRAGVHWVERAGIDGWRLDVPWKVPLEFWIRFAAAVKEARPDAYLVGEAWWSWGRLREVFDGLMNYRLRRALHDFCLHDHMDAEDLAVETRVLLDEAGGAQMLNLLGSHDTPRLLTLAEGDEQRAGLALAALFTFPGTPMLYYGDEVGLEGGDDPDCRRPMPWEPPGRNERLLAHVRRLIAIRRRHAALRRGDWQPVHVFNRVLAFRRSCGGDEVVVVLNAGPARQDVTIPLPSPDGVGGRGTLADTLGGVRVEPWEGGLAVPSLPARTALVLAEDDGAV